MPAAAARTFTLRELVAPGRGRAAPAAATSPCGAWAARLAPAARPSDLLGIGDDDVADPIGRSRRPTTSDTAAELDDLARAASSTAAFAGAPRRAEVAP